MYLGLDPATAEVAHLIDKCDYLFLRDLREKERDNHLHVLVEEARPGKPTNIILPDLELKDASYIESDESCALFELVFPEYVVYSVCNESYGKFPDDENFEGNLLRVFSNSHFLAYVTKTTFATAEYPGPLHHYQIACLNHVLDVVWFKPPLISRLR